MPKLVKTAARHARDFIPTHVTYRMSTEGDYITLVAARLPSGNGLASVYSRFAPHLSQTASGYGYDKISGAIASAAARRIECEGRRYLEYKGLKKEETVIKGDPKIIECLRALTHCGGRGLDYCTSALKIACREQGVELEVNSYGS